MSTTIESDWECTRLKEEIESLRAKVAELEAENHKFFMSANEEGFKTLRLENMLREIVDNAGFAGDQAIIDVDVYEKARGMI